MKIKVVTTRDMIDFDRVMQCYRNINYAELAKLVLDNETLEPVLLKNKITKKCILFLLLPHVDKESEGCENEPNR